VKSENTKVSFLKLQDKLRAAISVGELLLFPPRVIWLVGIICYVGNDYSSYMVGRECMFGRE